MGSKGLWPVTRKRAAHDAGGALLVHPIALCGRHGPLDALCRVVPICGLRDALQEARLVFLAVLDRYSLDGLVHRKAGLCALSHAA